MKKLFKKVEREPDSSVSAGENMSSEVGRELTDEELEQATGGIIPLVVVGVGLALLAYSKSAN